MQVLKSQHSGKLCPGLGTGIGPGCGAHSVFNPAILGAYKGSLGQHKCCRKLNGVVKCGVDDSSKPMSGGDDPGRFDADGGGFCIIEGRDTVKDFAEMQISELEAQIESRRSRIFLLMEEVRRMKILMRVKGGDKETEEEISDQTFDSAVPILKDRPFLKERNIRQYFSVYFWIAIGIIVFGGVIAPTLEVKMGMGGQSYMDFIRMMHLPEQLAYVDPIVASFCGGAIGVLSAFLIVDANYIRAQRRNRCYYCQGTGYLTCGSCIGSGMLDDQSSSRCPLCSGSGKVMCTNCFCTGKHLVTEHDPRIDPFD